MYTYKKQEIISIKPSTPAEFTNHVVQIDKGVVDSTDGHIRVDAGSQHQPSNSAKTINSNFVIHFDVMHLSKKKEKAWHYLARNNEFAEKFSPAQSTKAK